ncbi:MAG TPA: glycine cleavage system protein GcvH, partial [Pelomicrobium sp.]|nr:glycine cleavage system protein GcvH [Pelomicrobium sp.]
QDMLGDLVFVEAPEIGKHFAAGAECAVVESVKAAADIYAPVAGTVVAVNEELQSAPEKINEAPYAAWLFKLKPDNADDAKKLLTAAQYQSLVENEAA